MDTFNNGSRSMGGGASRTASPSPFAPALGGPAGGTPPKPMSFFVPGPAPATPSVDEDSSGAPEPLRAANATGGGAEGGVEGAAESRLSDGTLLHRVGSADNTAGLRGASAFDPGDSGAETGSLGVSRNKSWTAQGSSPSYWSSPDGGAAEPPSAGPSAGANDGEPPAAAVGGGGSASSGRGGYFVGGGLAPRTRGRVGGVEGSSGGGAGSRPLRGSLPALPPVSSGLLQGTAGQSAREQRSAGGAAGFDGTIETMDDLQEIEL